ncbi:nucleoside-diphosphate sugar epimerase/dehydratase [Nonomuraea dietziae]|uniref:nucleoside-diphosphate sugar epimerase/dehydratase n=1 Tax=Nonomuraea dietziae TaxID=65515 RepID=UPI00361C95FF
MSIDLACMTFSALMAGQTPWRVLLACVLVVAVNAAGRVYEPRILPSSLDRGFWLAGAGLVATLAAFWESASLTVAVIAAALFVFLAFCGRCVFQAAVRAARRRGGIKPAVVVGANPHGHRLASALLGFPEYGLLPIGFLDEETDRDTGPPVLGTLTTSPRSSTRTRCARWSSRAGRGRTWPGPPGSWAARSTSPPRLTIWSWTSPRCASTSGAFRCCACAPTRRPA